MLKPQREILHIHHMPRRARKTFRKHFVAARYFLQKSVGSDNQQTRTLRPRFGAGQTRQNQHAACDNTGMRGDTVIGLAIPIGKAQHFKIGGDEGHARFDLRLPLSITRHHDKGRGPFGRVARQGTHEIGQNQHIKPFGA